MSCFNCCGYGRGRPLFAYEETDAEVMDRLILTLPGLTPLQQEALRARYTGLLRDLHRRCASVNVLFYGTRVGMMLGSIAVPALLAAQFPAVSDSGSSSSKPMQSGVYWSTWALSLLTTACTAVHTLFRADRRFSALHTTYELLRSEGWQYLHLGGRYSGRLGAALTPTHANQLLYFVHAVERISMRLAEDEYVRTEGAGGLLPDGIAAPLGSRAGEAAPTTATATAEPPPKGGAAAATSPRRSAPPERAGTTLQPPSPAEPPLLVKRTLRGATKRLPASSSSSHNRTKTRRSDPPLPPPASDSKGGVRRRGVAAALFAVGAMARPGRGGRASVSPMEETSEAVRVVVHEEEESTRGSPQDDSRRGSPLGASDGEEEVTADEEEGEGEGAVSG